MPHQQTVENRFPCAAFPDNRIHPAGVKRTLVGNGQKRLSRSTLAIERWRPMSAGRTARPTRRMESA
jgi:hypothetical protein